MNGKFKLLKIIVICAAFAAVTAFALSGCTGISGIDATKEPANTTEASGTEAPANTESPEATPEGTQTDAPADGDAAAKRALDFARKVEGTWTADDDTFLDFSMENEKPWILSAVWNAGGVFPSCEIIDAEQKDADGYVYRLTVKVRESGEAATMNVEFSGNSMTVTTGAFAVPKIYTFYGNRQYPMEITPLTAAQLLEILGGRWSGAFDVSDYILVEEVGEEHQIKLTRGMINSEGQKTEYWLKQATPRDDLWEVFDLELVDLKTGKELFTECTFGQAGYAVELTFSADEGKKGFLKDEEVKIEEIDPALIFDLYKGTWTDDDNHIVHISKDSDKVYVMFAVWNAGGVFPAGEILKAYRISSEPGYELLLKMNNGVNASYFMIRNEAENALTVWGDGEPQSTYRYDKERQMN